MKPRILFILCVAALWTAMPARAQVSNDNEDGVYKVDERMAQFNQFVPGQVLVKFKDESTITVRKAKGKFASASNSAVNNVLQQFGVETMDKLFPTAPHKAKAALRRVKAPNGSIISETNVDKIYQIQMTSLRLDSTEMLAKALDSLDVVEYAEPNYIAYINSLTPNSLTQSFQKEGSPTGEEALSETSPLLLEATGEAATSDSVICADPSRNPLYSQQYGLTYEGLPELWQKPIVNGKRPVIAIIDTGVDITHPDLKDNIWTNEKEADGEDGYDNDGNGYKNDVHGWDFVNNTGDIRDYNSHGTHCAGIAAAADNEQGIIGANPRALIMPVTVMQSDGTGDYATIVKGINYAVQNGATVLSMSFGGSTNSHVLREALGNAYGSAVLVAAAGNDGLPIYKECAGPNQPSVTMFPAGYSFVLGVEALQKDGSSLASFSNFDCDGPNYSAETTAADPEGFNYELMAPGVNILSTIPNGQYKNLNGTSMATPLVAGAISALQMVKEYDNQEILWGDLTHSSTILAAYNITDRPAELDLLGMQMRDRKELTDGEIDDNSYATNDGEADAGETLDIYPILRTTFGTAKNIKLRLEIDNEYEDTTLVDILTPSVDFGMSLSAYGKGVSKNPLQLKLSPTIADGRHIMMKVVATADGTDAECEQKFTLIVTNMHKIGGLIEKDSTLTADKTWYVTDNLGIAEGATLRIEPGTRLEFAGGTGIRSFGKLIANGTTEKHIIFTIHNGSGAGNWTDIYSMEAHRDTLSYCEFSYGGGYHNSLSSPYASPITFDCSFKVISGDWPSASFAGERCNYIRAGLNENYPGNYDHPYDSYNFIDCWGSIIKYSKLINSNLINNQNSSVSSGKYEGRTYWIGDVSGDTPAVDHANNPSYLGTAREDFVRAHCYEAGNAGTFRTIDLSNMLTEPVHEAHGIVWKVVVDGKDAQDEYEDLAPLGVGKHEFCVWFNRPMNVNVAPQISFGVRDPYTQVSVAEDGSWSADSTKYTAYVTITGKTSSDGICQIYVRGAEDNEYFECPYEKTRFRVQVQAAGSMATGFAAEAGLGRVNLTWNNEQNNFDDAMGFNVYRYTMVNDSTSGDTIRLNQDIIGTDETAYTDYAVTPGTTYYYYYKVLSTDLKEYDISNVVACTPKTSTLGDANGSGEVDVADVVTTVNYAAGQEPKPFIFEAADMNADLTIDILDVIGIIKKIIHPDDSTATASALATATYSVENGTVYVESPVALAGVQVQLATEGRKDITTTDDLKNFENTSAWLSDDDYIFLAYNMNGRTLTPGRHALLNIGDALINNIRLSDAQGHNVEAVAKNATTIDSVVTSRMLNTRGIYNINGQKVAADADKLKSLPKGVYIVNGEKVVR